MARPRADAGGPDARERITEAFWGMLAEMPYADIKVTALARRARVSPNTLYYHFDGIIDIARHAIAQCLDAELAHALALADVEAVVRIARAKSLQAARVVSFARAGSAELTGMLVAALHTHWLARAGVEESQLSDAKRRELAFAFGGHRAVVGPVCPAARREAVDDRGRCVERIVNRGVVEQFVLSEDGQSEISYADYAIAMVDEAVSGDHVGQRIGVVRK